MPKQLVNHREATTRGLRPESFSARNSPWLTKCLNLRPTQWGLKAHYSLTQPITDVYITGTLGESKSWPSPQLFHGKTVTLLCFPDAVYTVNESTYTCTLVDTKALDGTSAAITTGKDWHFVDMYDSWMLFNGTSTVWKTAWSENVYTQDDVTIVTGATHKEGWLLLGGFSGFYNTVDWQTYWRDWVGDMPSTIDERADVAPGYNWIWWSSFLAPDMLQMFFQDALNYQSYATSPDTGFTSAKPFAIDLLERNEAGMRPMPWRGKVLGIAPLGDGMVVYGENGIRYLAPYNEAVVKTYGVYEFNGLPPHVGVYNGTTSRSAFCAGNDRHIFMEPSGELWHLLPNLQAERLGYREYLSGLDVNKVVITHDPLYDEFYIADGTLAYHLSKNGLSKHSTMPTKIHTLKSGAINTIKFSTDSSAAQIETEKAVTPTGEIQTLTRIRLVGLTASSTGWTLKVRYRTRPIDDWTDTASLSLDSAVEWNGAISVLEYKILLDATAASAVTLEDIEVEFDTDVYGGSSAKLAASTPSGATE